MHHHEIISYIGSNPIFFHIICRRYTKVSFHVDSYMQLSAWNDSSCYGIRHISNWRATSITHYLIRASEPCVTQTLANTNTIHITSLPKITTIHMTITHTNLPRHAQSTSFIDSPGTHPFPMHVPTPARQLQHKQQQN